MPTVAIYARYSTDMQSQASIEDQIRICQERADKEGWTIHQCYTDHGQSGATLLRPGIQMLLQDAQSGKFDIILSEAIDRLSRDQEDIAGIYKRMKFAGVSVVTLAEGEVNELHIGLKGTMGALFLKDLADKTRRGLRGRVEAGKSGGGNSYGYDVKKQLDANGEAIRGDRTINKAEAKIIKRIFNAYAKGQSPRSIAKALNDEGVKSPSGKGWGPSTIHGNRKRGTGILNNELYIGKLVWNRLRYMKDPDTGKRISRLNPEDEWVIQDVPHLRILTETEWQAVKDKQGAVSVSTRGNTKSNYWDRRRPKYLFSGLVKCGKCGGGVVNVNSKRVGCANNRNKGTCDNNRTMMRDELEHRVLDGLQNHLMDDELFAIFCDAYTSKLNTLRMEKNATLISAKEELAKIDKEQDKLVDAICSGVPAQKVKDRMIALEGRQHELESFIANTDEEPVLLHPNMSAVYRDKVSNLVEALRDEKRRHEAVNLIRGLVDKISLTPIDNNEKSSLAIDLQGTLAGILSLAAETKRPLNKSDLDESVKMVAGGRLTLDRPADGANKKDPPEGESTKLVAGARFELTTFRL
ncbi:recombinase family protein [Terasakiella sp.]|uniref:recombinase family protein n=1 Tax=Terasakiella sp. TaxID=2034861 RepID=UPI003AA8C71A